MISAAGVKRRPPISPITASSIRFIRSNAEAHMSAAALGLRKRSVIPGFGITLGTTLLWLSLIVLIPLAGLFFKTTELSFAQFIAVITSRRVLHAFRLSFGVSLLAAAVNLVFGAIVVWALTRYRFPG